jgi:hypothetical protein
MSFQRGVLASGITMGLDIHLLSSMDGVARLFCRELNEFVLHLSSILSTRASRDLAADSLSVVECKVPDTSSKPLEASLSRSRPRPHMRRTHPRFMDIPETRHHAHTTRTCVNYPNSLPANHLAQPKIAPCVYRTWRCSRTRSRPCHWFHHSR